MLSTEIAFGLGVLALLFALWTFFSHLALVRYVRTLQVTNVSLKRFTDLEAELTDHADSITSLHTSLKKLRSRIGMRKVRSDRKNGDGCPDWREDPDGYKRYMRLQLRSEGKLR